MTRLVIRAQQRCEFSLGQPAFNSRSAYAITEGSKVGNGQPTQMRVFLRRDNDCLIQSGHDTAGASQRAFRPLPRVSGV